MDDNTQQATQILSQGEFEPGRRPRRKSALEEASADVFCVLHAISKATYPIIEHAAKVKPQHVLVDEGMTSFVTGGAGSMMNEDSGSDQANTAQGLALRFSSDVVDPASGFLFGRGKDCDINLDHQNIHGRMSKKHFRIYINKDGILMLEDLSSNGTIVDNENIGGTGRSETYPKTRMLKNGTVIEILGADATNDVIKFVILIPRRECEEAQYLANFHNYMAFQTMAEEHKAKGLPMPEDRAEALAATQNGRFAESRSTINPLPASGDGNYGMQWNGGRDFTCIGVVGKGAFAIVYQIATTWDGKIFAAKELEKKHFAKNGVLDTRLSNELKIMKDLKHPNIVDYVHYHETNTHLYIIMEYVRFGDLQTFMHPRGAEPCTLPEQLGKQMTKQILSALSYLHDKDITHRDIKPDNILIASEEPFVVKLTDFGLSKMANDSDTFLKTFCGTLLYCAPEVFPYYIDRGPQRTRKRRRADVQRSYGQSVDIWSYAAVLWYALCGKPAFEGIADGNGQAMFERIMHTQLDTTALKQKGISDSCIDLLFEMLDVDASTRPTEQDCLMHPWLLEDDLVTPDIMPHGLAAIEEGDEGPRSSHLDLNDPAANAEPGLNESDSCRNTKRHKGETFYATREANEMPSSSEGSSLFAPLLNSPLEHAASANPGDVPEQEDQDVMLQQRPMAVLKTSGVFGTRMAFEPLESPIVDYDPLTYHGTASSPNGTPNLRLLPPRRMATMVQALAVAEPANPRTPAVDRAQHQKLESMVADLQMGSPEPSSSITEEIEAGMIPVMLDNVQPGLATGSDEGEPQGREQSAPRRSTFSRRITLAVPPSFYYDPLDPSTHNEAYAAQAALLMAGQSTTLSESTAPNTAPATMANTGMNSITSSAASQYSPNKENEQLSPPLSIPDFPVPSLAAFAKPSSVHGKLTSTASSFTSLTLNLTARYTSWGRNRHNTIVYRDAQDTRVAKDALELWFHAAGVEAFEAAGGDWTTYANLHVIVGTKSTKGIVVNGVRLPDRDAATGKKCYGRLYSGDEVCVSSGSDGKELRFVCEFFLGRSARVRGEKWPRFVVEVAEEVGERG